MRSHKSKLRLFILDWIQLCLMICLSGCISETIVTPLLTPTPMPATTFETKVDLKVQDTGLVVNGWAGNLAWSHNGKYLAYISGYSIWVVPIGKWSEKVQLYATDVDRTEASPYILLSNFLVWSPDDTRLGFTVTEPLDVWSGKQLMAQVVWPNGTFTLITEEEATLLDWAEDNRLLTYRDGFGIYDIEQQVWQTLEGDGGGNIAPFAQWLPDGTILYAASADWRWDSGGSIFIYEDSLGFEVLKTADGRPIHMQCDSTFPCFPVASPDENWIAWIEFEVLAETQAQQIMLYNRRTSTVIELLDSRDYGLREIHKLSWSSDSERLAFSAQRFADDSTMSTIWILDLINS